MNVTAQQVAPPRARALDPIDQLLSMTDVYRMAPEQVDVVRSAEIRRAVAFHVAHQSRYAAYCARMGFQPSMIAGPHDLWRVPLLPSALFKRGDASLRTRPSSSQPESVLETTSSGTQGSVSVVPRDNVTLMRFFASVSSGVRDVLGVDDFAMPVFNLGPAPDEAAHLWISYVLAGASVFFDSQNYVRGGRLLTRQLIDALQRASAEVVIIGPPALLLDLCNELPQALQLHAHSLVVSVGGWKRAGARAIDRQVFRARIGAAFGIEETRIRDAYNMVELNSVLFECAHRVKHVPPWLYVMAREPRSLALQGDGEAGILAYLDPTARSYPAFILSDDFGSVRRSVRCTCGLHTDVLTIERRINRIESRGCALKMNYTGPTQEGRS
jgi:long-chain-fatty-acid---luciferin-component ligase